MASRLGATTSSLGCGCVGPGILLLHDHRKCSGNVYPGIVLRLVHMIVERVIATTHKEVRNAFERMGSPNPSLAVDPFHCDRCRQLHRHGTGRAALMGGVLAPASAFPALVHRPLHVRAALCGPATQRSAPHSNGVTP